MHRRFLGRIALLLAAAVLFQLPTLAAVAESPDVLITRLSAETLEIIKADRAIKGGDMARIVSLVDSRIMPNLNFERMTASAVGPQWREATAAQKKQLQEEFKTLLLRTYSGALAQVNDQTITVKPLRAAPDEKDVVVRTEVRGRGDPIQLDYRLEKQSDGQWKIYNLNVLGVWLIETYRSQFAQEINAKGIDGLIASLAARNRSNGNAGPKG